MNIFKDDAGLAYAHPERSCKKCLRYPCLDNMDKLKSDFAKYGCVKFSDSDIFTIS